MEPRKIPSNIVKELFNENDFMNEQLSAPNKTSSAAITTSNSFPLNESSKGIIDTNRSNQNFSLACHESQNEAEIDLKTHASSSTSLNYYMTDSNTGKPDNYSNRSRRVRFEDKRESIIEYLITCEASQLLDDLDQKGSVEIDRQTDSDLPIRLMLSLSDECLVARNHEALADPVITMIDEVQIAKTDLSQATDRLESTSEHITNRTNTSKCEHQSNQLPSAASEEPTFDLTFSECNINSFLPQTPAVLQFRNVEKSLDIAASTTEDKNINKNVKIPKNENSLDQLPFVKTDLTEMNSGEDTLDRLAALPENGNMHMLQFVKTLEHLMINSNAAISAQNDQTQLKTIVEHSFESNLRQRTESSPAIVTSAKFGGKDHSLSKTPVVVSQFNVPASTGQRKNTKAMPCLVRTPINPSAKKKKVRFNSKTQIFHAGRGKSREPIVKDHRYPQSSQMRVLYRTKRPTISKVTSESISACSSGDAYDFTFISDDGDSTFEKLFHHESVAAASSPHPIGCKKRKTVGIQTDQRVSQPYTNQEQQTDNSLDNDIRKILQQTMSDFQKESSVKTKSKKQKSKQTKLFELTELKEVVRMTIREELRKAFPRRRTHQTPTAKPRRIIVKKVVTIKPKPMVDVSVQVMPRTNDIGLNTPKRFPSTVKADQKRTTLPVKATINEKKTKETSVRKTKSKPRKASNERAVTGCQTAKVVESNKQILTTNRKNQTAGSSGVRKNQRTLSQCLKNCQPTNEEQPIELLEIPETPSQPDDRRETSNSNTLIDENQRKHEKRRSSLNVSDLTHSRRCFRIPSLHVSIAASNKSQDSPLSISYHIAETDALANQDVEQLNVLYNLMDEMRLSSQYDTYSQHIVPESEHVSGGKYRRRRSLKARRNSLHPYLNDLGSIIDQQRCQPFQSSDSGIEDEYFCPEPIPIGPINDPELNPNDILENIGKNFIINYLNRKLPNIYEHVRPLDSDDLDYYLINGQYDQITLKSTTNVDSGMKNKSKQHRAPFCSSVKSSQELYKFSPGISSISSHDEDDDILTD
ncbi:uncharacterized protein LOC129723235 isoform X2 [Wyeomyia smithii]|uniref:uncharacterized protein LOC129723235 isoform X2 n=1 Tax=Wyeomyia smithii TaxID=174621 RepID=UPI002467B78F|nr:uncharacterized protein LOC129723235 isoform X2 [Wyeomyia smithii]